MRLEFNNGSVVDDFAASIYKAGGVQGSVTTPFVGSAGSSWPCALLCAGKWVPPAVLNVRTLARQVQCD